MQALEHLSKLADRSASVRSHVRQRTTQRIATACANDIKEYHRDTLDALQAHLAISRFDLLCVLAGLQDAPRHSQIEADDLCHLEQLLVRSEHHRPRLAFEVAPAELVPHLLSFADRGGIPGQSMAVQRVGEGATRPVRAVKVRLQASLSVKSAHSIVAPAGLLVHLRLGRVERQIERVEPALDVPVWAQEEGPSRELYVKMQSSRLQRLERSLDVVLGDPAVRSHGVRNNLKADAPPVARRQLLHGWRGAAANCHGHTEE
jgi:hypothetical protein